MELDTLKNKAKDFHSYKEKRSTCGKAKCLCQSSFYAFRRI